MSVTRWLFILWLFAATEIAAQPRASDPSPTLEETLKKLAPLTAEACGVSAELDQQDEQGAIETAVFHAVAKKLLLALNNTIYTGAPEEKVRHALADASRESDAILSKWPAEQRLRGNVVASGKLILVSFGVRSDATYAVYGQVSNKQGENAWQQVGSDYERTEDPSSFRSISLYPLEASASGDPRFLASIFLGGCAGSSGIRYRVYQWSGVPGKYLEEVLSQDGAFGMDSAADGFGPSAKEPFHPVGKLKTEGSSITLPYCWFSGIDTWDNPSMCAEDRYDLRGESVRFVGRRYNRPDLLPIVKVIEYTNSHDLPAAAAYCASEAIARRVKRGPYWGEELDVKRVRTGVERVTLAESSVFTVALKGDRWVVSDYQVQ